jgi:hypothetical protein
MKIPLIKYNDKVLNNLSWFLKIGGITLFPFIILRDKYKGDKTILNHESIHIEQQKELLVIIFYLWYVLEWLVRLFLKGNAYRNISFEREAYQNECDVDYIKNRKRFSFLKYLK